MFGWLGNRFDLFVQWISREKRLSLRSLEIRRLLRALKHVSDHPFITDAAFAAMYREQKRTRLWALNRFLSVRKNRRGSTFRNLISLRLSNLALKDLDVFFTSTGFSFFGLPLSLIKSGDLLVHGLLHQMSHGTPTLTDDELQNAQSAEGIYFGFFASRLEDKNVYEGRVFALAVEQLTDEKQDDESQFGFSHVLEVRLDHWVHDRSKLFVRLRHGPLSPSSEERFILLRPTTDFRALPAALRRRLRVDDPVEVEKYQKKHVSFIHIEFGKREMLTGKFMDESKVGSFAIRRLDAALIDADLISRLLMGECDLANIQDSPFKDILAKVPKFSVD